MMNTAMPRHWSAPVLRTATVLLFLLAVTVLPAAAQSSGVIDNFDRADASSLGVATSGQTWAVHAGSPSIAGGQAAPGSGFLLASIDAGTTEPTVRMTLVQSGPEFWMVVRFADAANYWRFGRWRGESYTLQQVSNNGIASPVIEFGTAMTPQAGDALFCRVRQALLQCGVNDVTVASTTSAAGASATRVGVSSYTSEAARFDNFSASIATLPDLAVTMIGPASVYFGTEALWRTTVANIGAVMLEPAELTIVPPAAVSNVVVSGAACGNEGALWRCSIAGFAVGQTHVIEIRATAPSVLGDLTFVSSVATAATEADLANNTFTFTSTTRPVPSSTAALYDSFNRSAGPLLNADTGQQWIHYANPLTIAADEAAAAGGFVLSAVDAGEIGGEVSATVVTPSSELWIVFRLSNASNYWRFGRWGNEPYQLQRVQGNVATILPRVATITTAPLDAVRCRYLSDQIECSANGVVVAQVADSFNLSATRVGFSTWQSPATRFDELTVVALPPDAAEVNVAIGVSGPSTLQVGHIGSWSITYRNAGTNDIQGGEVTISLPSGLAQTAATGASCTLETVQYRCTVPPAAPGYTVTIILTGAASAATSLSVRASTAVLPGEVLTTDNTATYITSVVDTPPQEALIVDRFNRPNSTALGVAETGQVWTAHYAGIGIQQDRAALGAGFTLATLDAAASTVDVSATVVTTANEFWLVLRLSDASNYWRFGRRGGQEYELQQVRAGAIVVPPITTFDNIVPADGDRLSCRVKVTAIDCAVNDLMVARTADPFNQDATRVGLSGYQALSARFDDFVAISSSSSADVGVSVQSAAVALAGELQTVTVSVANHGGTPAGDAMLVIALPSVAHSVQMPAGCSLTGVSELTCPLGAALLPGGTEQFVVMFTVDEYVVASGDATVQIPVDAFPADNHAPWTTRVEAQDGVVFDNFNREDTQEGLGTAVTGQPWQALSGGFRITGGQARATGAGAIAVLDPGFAFGTLEVVLANAAEASGVVFRVVDAQNYYRLAVEAGVYRVMKVVDGVARDLQFHIVRHATAPHANDVVRIVSRPDDGIFVVVNGRHIIDGGDQQFMHATGWGLLARTASAVFDSFMLRPVLEGLPTSDSFDGTPGMPLRAPSSGVSYQWMSPIGAPFSYGGGFARPGQAAYAVTTLDTSSERSTTSVTVVRRGPGAWIAFRYQETSLRYFRFGTRQGAAYAVDYRAGVLQLAMPVPVEQLQTIMPSEGDRLEVRQSSDGTVECFVNGLLTHRFVDTVTAFRSTVTGLVGEDATVAFDDFVAVPPSR
jgi:hypothetical protein